MDKKNPAVSVIVALFNAEKYIGDCLTSLANQTFQNFEIIVADDCSTDNSRAVVGKFFSTFGGRLKLMTLSPNSGCPGIPRNFAMTEARGEYVYFLDGDDLLSETALEELYTVAENFNADVVHCERCLAFYNAGGQICAESVSYQTGVFVTEPTLETADIGKRMEGFIGKRFVWWACTKLFRRQLLIDNAITFPAIIDYEDFIFVLKTLLVAKNYVRVPFVNYFYRQRADSVSGRGYNALELTRRLIDTVNLLNDFMDGEDFFKAQPRFRYALIDFFVQMRLGILSEGFFISNDYDPSALFEVFRQKIFSVNPQDNVALTAYLFVAANVFKNHLEGKDKL